MTDENDFRMTHQGDRIIEQREDGLLSAYGAQQRRIAELEAKLEWVIEELKTANAASPGDVRIRYLLTGLGGIA